MRLHLLLLNQADMLKFALPFCLLLMAYAGTSQVTDSTKLKTTTEAPKPAEKKWYENISLRGYAQVRYNGLLETNENLGCEQCDKSWGGNNGIFIRRMRLVIYGHLTKRVYFYLQPDFASSTGVSGGQTHFAQIRDAYFDIGLDNESEFRIRIGQSKVPYGFENMQSSQNRLPFDRDDALNSAVANERDLGAIAYWAPKKYRDLFSDLVKSGLKGTGDYGVVGLGIYNGQTANQPELNDNFHVVGRVTYPFHLKDQIMEGGIQAYTGKYVVSNLSAGVKTNADKNYTDQRVAASLVLYPKPFGFQAEYNVGKGPEYNKVTDSIEVQNLKGGYILVNYQWKLKSQILFPYARWQYYDGGKKQEKDARSYEVKELEFGLEWQPMKQFEFVAAYVISDRTYEDHTKPDNHQEGNLLRLQAQLNF